MNDFWAMLIMFLPVLTGALALGLLMYYFCFCGGKDK